MFVMAQNKKGGRQGQQGQQDMQNQNLGRNKGDAGRQQTSTRGNQDLGRSQSQGDDMSRQGGGSKRDRGNR